MLVMLFFIQILNLLVKFTYFSHKLCFERHFKLNNNNSSLCDVYFHCAAYKIA